MTELVIPSKPKRLIIELSRNCNLHCIMCGFGGQPINQNWYMDERIIGKFFDPQYQEFLSEINEFRLNGRGESTLHPSFIETLNKFSRSFPDARLTLFTNLMVANKKIINALTDYGVETYISVDSANPENFEKIRLGAKFDIVTNRLKYLKNGFLVFTLQTHNFNDVEAIGRLAAYNNMGLIINVVRTDDIDYKSKFLGLLNNNWANLMEQFRVLHKFLDNSRLLIPDQIWGLPVPESIATTISCGRLVSCPNILQELMVAYDGTVYPCNMFNSEIYGNILETPLYEMWGSKPHQSFLKIYKGNSYCNYCEYMIPK